MDRLHIELQELTAIIRELTEVYDNLNQRLEDVYIALERLQYDY